MSLIEKLIEKRMAEYETQKPYSTGHFAPRKGFYLLRSKYNKVLGSYPFNSVPMATCLWSPDGESFFEHSQVDIMLPPLYQRFSSGPKHFQIDTLVGKIIEVTDLGFVKLIGDEKFPHPLVLTWKISERSIPIKNAIDVALDHIFSQGATLSSAEFDIVEYPDLDESYDIEY